MATPTKSKKPASSIEGLSEQAQGDIKSATQYVADSYKPKWSEAWQLYRGERTKIGYNSQSGVNSFDPMTYNNIETNIANVFGSKPRMVYLPTKLEQQKETRALNQMADYTWDRNDLSLEIIPYGRELFITGNATLWNTWEDDWIKTKRVSINDCLFDPNAHSSRDWKYAGYRYLTTLDDLKDVKIYNPDTDEWTPKYKDVEKIPVWTNGDNADLDKQLKDCYTGSTLDGEAKKEQVEVSIVYYVRGKYKGKVIELANRTIELYSGDSQFQKAEETKTVHVAQYNQDGTPQNEPMQNEDGTPNPKGGTPVFKMEKMKIDAIKPFVPVAFGRDTIDGSLLYGMGQVEPNADSQELLNDTITQKRDNVTANINSMYFVDPKFKDQITKIKNLPNAVYAIPPDAIKPMDKQDMTGAADIEIQRLKESMRNTAAIDEVTAGMAPEHQSTATQINSQLGQANQRFSIKLQSLENETFKQLADIWFKMFRIFVTEEQVVRVTGRKGVDWLKLDPDMYWGEYEPKVTLDQNAKSQRDDEIKRIEGVANILMNNPYVDQKELTRIVTTRLLEFDDDEAETLMVKDSELMPQQAPQPPQGAPMPQGAGMPPGMPQGQMPPGMAAMPQGAPQQAPQQAPQGPSMPGVPNMPNGQLPANPAAMAAMAKAMAGSQPGPNDGPKTISERIMETIDYTDLPEDMKRVAEEQVFGQSSQMASPTQQGMNIQAMKLQHDQTKHDLSQSQAQHTALLNEHKALLETHKSQLAHQAQQHQQELAMAQHQMSSDNQSFTQKNTQDIQSFDQKMRQKEINRPQVSK